MSIEIQEGAVNHPKTLDSEPLSMIGRTLGKYTLVELIGAGGMGHVYRAKHQLLGRSAAIKLLLPSLSTDPTVVERFFREAVMTSHIKHSGIVEVYDYGTEEDPDGSSSAYLVMELLTGESLHERLVHEGPMSVEDAVDLAKQIVSALDAAHQLNVVHRDLKPSNIFLIADELMPQGERVKVLDFGIAKAFAQGPEVADLTVMGAVLGTPAYMSPEQLSGDSIDSVSDLYSVGCLLFRMLTGRPPFECETHGEFILAHALKTPPSLSEFGEFPETLTQLVAGLLAANPLERPSHRRVRELLTLLESSGRLNNQQTMSAEESSTPSSDVGECGDKDRMTLLGSAVIESEDVDQKTVVTTNPFGHDQPTVLALPKNDVPPTRANQASYDHAMGPLLTPLQTILPPPHELAAELERLTSRRPTTTQPTPRWWQLESRSLWTIAGTALIVLTIGLIALVASGSDGENKPAEATDTGESSGSSTKRLDQPRFMAAIMTSPETGVLRSLRSTVHPTETQVLMEPASPASTGKTTPIKSEIKSAPKAEKKLRGSRKMKSLSSFVSVRSKPSGAEVRFSLKGPSLGQTPILLERTSDTPQTIWVELDGFERSQVVLNKDVIGPVVLEPQAALDPFDRM